MADAKLVGKIKEVSKKILRGTLQLMNDLQDEDSEYVDDVIDAINDADADVDTEMSRLRILEVLQNVSVTFIGDAEVVDAEMEHFKLENNEVDFEHCPYLSQVWNGDIYDKTENEGLQALLDDLQEQSSRVTAENLIQTAIGEM